MQKYTLFRYVGPLLVILSVVEGPIFAQKPTPALKANLATTAAPKPLKLDMDSTITSLNTVTIKGQKLPYTAQVGTQPVWDEAGKVIAVVFYNQLTLICNIADTDLQINVTSTRVCNAIHELSPPAQQ